ncbi:hypothetical protein P3102_24155 [Amycolatopsis sp. QT-25]|uniref:hypothetical protein n=1 Tax=Amycolatopsis sp. QT-25 TaxID=3034022 RepID=UPI0023EDD2D5|nr:hypothetical protein [Amycolatopsis sp. QT-25]WET77177.1 hypothetical protein P3102_24155 [Amycolatopsis sp. QT-25]
MGLTISTVASNDALSYLAIDPADENEPIHEVDLATINEARHFRPGEDIKDLPSSRLINAALNAS